MSKLRTPVNDKDHLQGDKDAPIELVEFGDYQCPYCGHAYPIIKKIQGKLGKKLKFVFRNFPLSELHPHAVNAAIAAEAAALQGKFWEMHDIIFEHQSALEDKSLLKYANQIGLDAGKFEQAIKADYCQQKVEADFEDGIRSGVNGTPSFFINGSKYDGSWEYEDFLEYLQAYGKQTS